MASGSGLDIEALLAPISEDAPCGRDVRDNPSPNSNYQLIKIARNTARSTERNSMYSEEGQQADDAKRKIEESWRKVIDLAPKVLRSEGKDLEIACWYAEARVRRDGFAGLNDSFKIIDGLISRYWDHLYPMPDEYGMETRVSPIAGLNGEGAEGVLLAPIRNSIIAISATRAFSYWDYQQAVETQRMLDADARASQAQKQGFTLAQIEAAVRDAAAADVIELHTQIAESLATFSAVNQKLNGLCGTHEAPPTSNIISLLSECLNAVEHLGKSKLPSAEAASAAPETTAATTAASGAATPEAQGVNSAKAMANAVVNRDIALKQLQEIAEFFRKTEPHSPLSYLLEKTVRWGNLSLQELLQELIPDSTARSHFGELTGVKTDD